MYKHSRVECSAFEAAIYYITFKNRTEKEVRYKLNEKGYSVSDIEIAIEKLYEYSYLDDEYFARSYIKSNAHKKSAKLLGIELINKGIDSQLAKDIVAQAGVDEYQTIYNLMKRKYENYDLMDDSQRRKIYSYFARRGFGYENISKVMSVFRNNGEK